MQVSSLPDFPALQALKKRPSCWVSWSKALRNGKWIKQPIDPHRGGLSSVSNPKLWGSYEQALHRARSNNLDGVGIMLTADDNLTGIDLDKCVNIDDEFNPVIAPWAQEILDLKETYAEYSPSGTGIRLFALGKEESYLKADKCGVEFYVTGRYLTVTGNHIPGSPIDLAPAPHTIARLRERVATWLAATSAVNPTINGPSKPVTSGNGHHRPGLLLRSLTADRPDFFRNVNEAALQPGALAQWVPGLFGSDCRYQPGTGAWRVSSKSLGRDLEEDLSITPHGIRDFGEEIGLTPIDVVMNFGHAPNAKDAAFWICDAISVSRETLGWVSSETSERFDPNQGSGHNQNTEKISGVTPKPSKLIFEDITTLRALPPTKWLVKGWLEEGSYGILRGRWGAGKSFLGFDLALHLAYGLPDWHGARLPSDPSEVLILAREGHTGFVRRIDAFQKHHKIELDTECLTFLRAQLNFMDAADFNALLAAITATGKRFRLIIVDTVSRVMAGTKINEDQNVTLFMERIAILARLTGATVIGVHHENKSGGTFGSIFFENNADFVFSVMRQIENGEPDDAEPLLEGPLTAAKISCAKMKDGEDGWNRTVRFKLIDLTPANSLGIPDEDEVSSLVVETIEGQAARNVTSPNKDVYRRALALIDAEWKSGHPLARGRNSPRRIDNVILREFPSLGPRKKIEQLIEDWMSVTPPIVVEEMYDRHTKSVGLKVVGSI